MKRILPLFLALVMLLGLLSACGGKASSPDVPAPPVPSVPRPSESATQTDHIEAQSMRLEKIIGTVALTDEKGEDVKPVEQMRLFSGNALATEEESRAGISLDENKAATLGALSRAVLSQEEKKLAMDLTSGELFFFVSKPLEDDESFDIQTDTMTLGIRGTCGYVRVLEEARGTMIVLTGGQAVIRAVTGEEQTIRAGERVIVMIQDDGVTTFEVTPATPGGYPPLLTEGLLNQDAALSEAADQAKAEPDQVRLASVLDQYRAVIAQAEELQYPNSDYKDPDAVKNYAYTLIRMQEGDVYPTLLVRMSFGGDLIGWHGFSRLFRYDPVTKEMYAPVESLEEGDDLSSYSTTNSLTIPANGPGLYNLRATGTTGEGSLSRITAGEAALEREETWSGRMSEYDLYAYESITWHLPSDRAPFEEWLPADHYADGSLPTDGDRIVFTGTLRNMSASELIELQGYEEQRAILDDGGHYLIIQLDKPQEMGLRSGDGTPGPIIGTVSLLGVRDDSFASLDGQHHIFSIDPNTAAWPSDVSFPIRQPRTRDLHVLD